MNATNNRTTPVTVRMPWNMLERVDALRPMLGADDRSTVARTLMEYGLRAIVQGVEPPPVPDQTEDEAAAVVAYVRRELREQLGVLASHRPTTALREGWIAAAELVKWCDELAAAHGTDTRSMLDAIEDARGDADS